jgi:hypothetical protein
MDSRSNKLQMQRMWEKKNFALVSASGSGWVALVAEASGALLRAVGFGRQGEYRIHRLYPDFGS